MDKRIVDTRPIKKRLAEFMKLLREIENQIERLERLESTMASPSSPKLSGMPRSGSFTDKYAINLSRAEELDTLIRDAIKKEQAERDDLEQCLQWMALPDERQVIRLKYFDRCRWDEIAESLFIDEKELTEDFDKYRRRAYRLHTTAIKNLAQAVVDRQNASRQKT